MTSAAVGTPSSKAFIRYCMDQFPWVCVAITAAP